MAAIRFEGGVEIPFAGRTWTGFRRWRFSADVPEQGRVDDVGGRIEVDASPERAVSRGLPKIELIRALANHVQETSMRLLFADRLPISSRSAPLSAKPDLCAHYPSLPQIGARSMVQTVADRADRLSRTAARAGPGGRDSQSEHDRQRRGDAAGGVPCCRRAGALDLGRAPASGRFAGLSPRRAEIHENAAGSPRIPVVARVATARPTPLPGRTSGFPRL